MNLDKTYLGSDKLQTRELPPCLLLDQRVDLGIGILQGSVKILVLLRSALIFLFFSIAFPCEEGGLTKSLGTGMEDDILIELFSVVDVRLIEGVMDLKAFRSIGVIERRNV